MKSVASILLLSGLVVLTGCGKPTPPPYHPLTCKDNPEGRTKEERQEIADDCFIHGPDPTGNFPDSSGKFHHKPEKW